MKKAIFSALTILTTGLFAQLPAVYDLRTQGLLTPVKDQGNCGSCWAFASIAAIESNWLKNGHGVFDLSEDNIIDCHQFDELPCQGGSYYMTSALLSRYGGPLLTADDPYTPNIGNCPNTLPFPPLKPALVEEIRFLPPVQSVIKEAILNYGAVASAMFFTMANYNASTFKYYDNYIDSNDSLNAHCVAIVGWNDNMTFPGAPANGGWIIKDSYGTNWAENGYFYVSYYDAGILSENVIFPSRRSINYTSNAPHVYYLDKYGWVDNFGYGNQTAYALARYVLTPSYGSFAHQQIKRVGTFATHDNTRIKIELFGTKNGNTLEDFIDSASVFAPYKGFYTIPFNLSTMSLGSEIFIKASYYCPNSTTQPIPIETFEAGHTSNIYLSANSSWVSPNLSYWSLTGQSTTLAFNVCLKLYTESAPMSVLGYVPDTICHMDWLLVNQNTAMPFDSLQWLVNGSYVSNEPFLHHIFFDSGPGDYIISLVSWLGSNSDTASASIHVKICLGINQPEEISWEIFPNPAKNKVFIRSANIPNSSIAIFDMTGKTVFTIKPEDPITEVNIGNWPAGVYFVEFRKNYLPNGWKKIIVY